MGIISSRQNAGVEEVDININHAYKYPPKSGHYFSDHFIMGGERFDTAHPEMYLFGENSDLNFLGSRPAPFPYPAPTASEPNRTLKALVNIRKESLRFVRVPDDSLGLKEQDKRSTSLQFNIEFTFDCDVRCAITIMYFCTEEVSPNGLIYSPRNPSMNSETYHYKRGANQQFSQVCHVFDPSKYSDDELSYSFDDEVMPIVICCETDEGEDSHQIHSTIAVVEKHSDGYVLKPLKQKLFVDGLCYLLQEIYGIENKNSDGSKVGAEDDTEDNGAECVICMCDLRDTLILPCRHLCLCNSCADSLRYQANNCPICRSPFRALLQIKALQKTSVVPGNGGAVTATNEGSEGLPAGYQSVPLIEALNGPSMPQQPAAPPYQDMYVQLPQNAVDGVLDGTLEVCDTARQHSESTDGRNRSNALEDSTTQTDHLANEVSSVKMRMSVLLAKDSPEEGERSDDLALQSSSKTWTSTKKDSCESNSEIGKPSQHSNVGRKKRTPLSSPISPTKEKDCLKADFEAEESTETLSLLDPIQACSLVGSVPLENECLNSIEGEDIVSPGTFDDKISAVSDDTKGDSGKELSVEASFKSGKSSRRSKQKHRRSSSRRSYSSTTPSQNQESLGPEEEVYESHSLPGTPLSTSSAVSRTSDASVSSASSTRALIISHPSKSSNSTA